MRTNFAVHNSQRQERTHHLAAFLEPPYMPDTNRARFYSSLFPYSNCVAASFVLYKSHREIIPVAVFSFKSLTQRTEKPNSLLLLFLFTLLLLLFMLRFHAFVALFSVALHQLPLFPILLNVPLLLRLPPGRAA